MSGRRMMRKPLNPIAALAILLAGSSATPARADFYTLEGRFKCLESGSAACADTSHLAEKPGPTDRAGNDAVIQAPPTLTNLAPMPNGKSRDPLLEIAARIEAGKPLSDDLHRLRVLSRTGDGRAIELLAWCDYFGIGLPRDPVPKRA